MIADIIKIKADLRKLSVCVCLKNESDILKTKEERQNKIMELVESTDKLNN